VPFSLLLPLRLAWLLLLLLLLILSLLLPKQLPCLLLRHPWTYPGRCANRQSKD
jgi:hypothetical protein